ncbi:MAG: hypothetical protein K2X27_23240 [Candidatus Obscuribacterales bacterium]|nr:hypothetical protein [Candidatus Obscuribacterales bacterium]
MDGLKGRNAGFSKQAESEDKIVSVVQSMVPGKEKLQRVTSTCQSGRDMKVLSILVEEFQSDRLLSRRLEVYSPQKLSSMEIYDKDGLLISSETERHEKDGKISKIVLRGTGKSQSTRISIADLEARASERAVLIETARASYSYYPYEGKWTSFYKHFSLKLELKSNYLKNPDSVIDGPDGIRLIFKSGKLIDLQLTTNYNGEVPSFINGVDGSIIL